MTRIFGESDGWRLIANPTWKARFLNQIHALEGFHELVEHSRDTKPHWPFTLSSRIAESAVQLLTQYSREELRMARLYYNAQHLAGFWRYYLELIEAGISEGRISKQLPLFVASRDPLNYTVILNPVTIDQLKGDVFIKADTGRQSPSYTREGLNYEQGILSETLSADEVLASLDGRINLINDHFHKTCLILYELFLFRERQAVSEIWDCYNIHVFLDNFLFWTNQAGNRTSRFDFVFFVNNRVELMVWLKASLAAGKQHTVKDAEMFLYNQTKYYLGLSQRITYEENEVLNSHKELLFYDETEKIVRLGSVPSDISDESKKLIQVLGLSSMGCPFARAKGAKLSALTEMYQYFDQLFVRVLECSWEFEHLFYESSTSKASRQ